jgi:hypothetical protein
VDSAWGGSPWTSGSGSAWSHRHAIETALRLTEPRREEFGSKGEMRGTHSRGLWERATLGRRGQGLFIGAGNGGSGAISGGSGQRQDEGGVDLSFGTGQRGRGWEVKGNEVD